MHEDFHGRYLQTNSRQVLSKLLLVHYLDRHLLASDGVRGQFYLGEAAGTDRLVQLVEPVKCHVAVTLGDARRGAFLFGRQRRCSGGGLRRCRHLALAWCAWR